MLITTLFIIVQTGNSLVVHRWENDKHIVINSGNGLLLISKKKNKLTTRNKIDQTQK